VVNASTEIVLRIATNTHSFPCRSICSDCPVLIHRECAQFPCTIKISTHDRSLTCTYSLSQVKKQENVLCKLCCKKVNTEYAAYYCQKCGYIAHLKCAYEYGYRVLASGAPTESVVNNSVGYETHLVHLVDEINLAKDERVGPRQINHFSHPHHNLILINEKLVDVKHCEACIQFIIFTPFYGCAQCNFFSITVVLNYPQPLNGGYFTIILSQDMNCSGVMLVDVITMASYIDVTNVNGIRRS
jgi:hypothetical protein